MLTFIKKSHSTSKHVHNFYECSHCHTTVVRRQRKVLHDSCGCQAGNYRHRCEIGKKKTVELTCYRHILSRCYNPNTKDWMNYGGRGIRVCDRWLGGFQFFLEDMGLRPEGPYSIDRIDNDGNYDPDNCRWATRTEQNNNTRRQYGAP